MPGAEEIVGAKTQLASDLAQGVKTLSLDQTVCFKKYIRQVLPLDGFVFWIRADLLSGAALRTAGKFAVNAHDIIEVQGSLHYTSALSQEEDSTIAVNQVVFTALQEVQDLSYVSPNVLYIADGPDGLRFSFSTRQKFYYQAGLYHYIGNALYSTMATQVIDQPSQIDLTDVVVSNSLPIWLAIGAYSVPWVAPYLPTPPLFPSFAVPNNYVPPYGAIHIPPDSTRALASAPYLAPDLSHSQLLHDTVRITLYGVRNAGALSFHDLVNQYSLDTDAMGIMNMPAFRDEKKTQVEMAILAMKKTAEFEVSYFQATARAVAQQVIKQAIPIFQVVPPVVDPITA